MKKRGRDCKTDREREVENMRDRESVAEINTACER